MQEKEVMVTDDDDGDDDDANDDKQEEACSCGRHTALRHQAGSGA